MKSIQQLIKKQVEEYGASYWHPGLLRLRNNWNTLKYDKLVDKCNQLM